MSTHEEAIAKPQPWENGPEQGESSDALDTPIGAAPAPRRAVGQAPNALVSHANSVLQTDRGKTTIADTVVTKVAGIAAREVPGVHDLGGTMSRTLGSVTSRVGLGDSGTQGVSVEVGEREAAVDLIVVIDYGESIPEVAREIRDNVSLRIEGICGLRVTEVNIAVNDLFMPGDDQSRQESRVQ